MKKLGLAAFEGSANAYRDLSTSLVEQQAEELNTQLAMFQSTLNYFAVEHAAQIRTEPQFREQFARMCGALGIDPLASSTANKSNGSLWAALLGKDVNDFYFELAVRIVEICRVTRNANGGLISVAEVRTRLADQSQLRPVVVSDDDVERAVKSLAVLGSGFGVIDLSGRLMIRSVPSELSSDHMVVFEACQALGYVTVTIMRDNFGWTAARASTALDEMLAAGLLWIDQDRELKYWVPNWIER